MWRPGGGRGLVVAAAVLALAVALGAGWRAGGWEVVGGITGLVALIPLVWGLLQWARHPSARVATSVQVDEAADTLASLVSSQWHAESAARRLEAPEPLAVRWRPTRLAVSDVPALHDHLYWRSDQVDRLAVALRRGGGRLAIIGAPGSGKTTLAVLLTLALCRHRSPADPVPVFLSAASWDPMRERFLEWVRRRLGEDYPGLGAAAFRPGARPDLVSLGRVLPVVDGLDELPEARRARAFAAINHTLTARDPLVVTSRTEEYAAVVEHPDGDPLVGATVIESLPVRLDDLQRFVCGGATAERASRWRPVLDRIERGGPVADALASPLMASIARLVYAHDVPDPDELLDAGRFPSRAAVEDHLLEHLVPALLRQSAARDPGDVPARARPAHEWSSLQVRQWLGTLAGLMGRRRTYDFAWWDLARGLPAFSRLWSRALVAGGLGALGGLVVAAAAAATAGTPAYAPGLGLVFGIPIGLATCAAVLVGPTGGRHADGARPKGRFRSFARSVATGLASGAVFAACVTLVFGPSLGYRDAVSLFIALTRLAGIGFGLAVGGVGLLGMSDQAPVSFRLRGRWLLLGPRLARGLGAALGYALVLALATGLVFGWIVGVTFWATDALAGRSPLLSIFDFYYGLIAGTFSNLPLSFLIGGVFSIGVGLVLGVLAWARTPVQSDEPSGPAAALRSDRAIALAMGVLLTLAYAAPFTAALRIQVSLIGRSALPIPILVAGGLLLSGAIGAVAGLLSGAWPFYQLAAAWLALRGRLPWRLMTFLEDAHRLGILRQVGATYQFRHARLQDHLAR